MNPWSWISPHSPHKTFSPQEKRQDSSLWDGISLNQVNRVRDGLAHFRLPGYSSLQPAALWAYNTAWSLLSYLQTECIGWNIVAVITLMTKCCFKMASIWNPHVLHVIIWFCKCLDIWWKFALTLALTLTHKVEHTSIPLSLTIFPLLCRIVSYLLSWSKAISGSAPELQKPLFMFHTMRRREQFYYPWKRTCTHIGFKRL